MSKCWGFLFWLLLMRFLVFFNLVTLISELEHIMLQVTKFSKEELLQKNVSTLLWCLLYLSIIILYSRVELNFSLFSFVLLHLMEWWRSVVFVYWRRDVSFELLWRGEILLIVSAFAQTHALASTRVKCKKRYKDSSWKLVRGLYIISGLTLPFWLLYNKVDLHSFS